MQKIFVLITALGIASGAFANPASAEIIKTDAGLAGKEFCWSGGADNETYNRDHTYIYNVTATGQKIETYKGTWTISKDGTITLKLDGGTTALRRYDIDGDHVKELTGSVASYGGGGGGKVC